MEAQTTITFSEEARNIIRDSRIRALELGNAFITSDHILLSMLDADRPHLPSLFKSLGLPVEKLRDSLTERLRANGVGEPIELGNMPLKPEAEDVMHQTVAEYMRRQGEAVIGAHILLAILQLSECDGAKTLAEYEVTYEDVERALAS